MKKIKNLGLVWKLTSIISIFLLITTAFICVIYIQTFKRKFSEEAEEKLRISLNSMQNNIDESLDDADSFLDQLLYGREFPYFMDQNNILSDNEMRYYISNLDKDLVSTRYLYNNKYSDIGIYSSNQQISEQQYEWQFYLNDLEEKPYYTEIIAHINVDYNQSIYGSVRDRGLISSTLNTESLSMGDSGIRILPIYRLVKMKGSTELVGVVEVDVDVVRLADREDLAAENNDVGILLLDNKYHVLFDTMSLSEEEQQNTAVAIDKEGLSDVMLKGETYLITSNVCPRTGLVSAALVSKGEIMSNIMTQVARIILISVIGWVMMVIVIFWFVKRTLKRLVVLDQMMGRVGEGDFAVEISKDRDDDEITRITQSFNKMASRLNDVMEEKVKNEQAQKEAELRALQAQINPHFLYNTLENMRMQCEIDEYYTISKSLSALGNLFRYSIRWGSNEAIFQLEWENLKDYLDIMKMRFDEDVEYDLYCEPDLEEIVVPKLMLQPLVENCFNHGFKDKLPPWKLTVKAVKRDERLCITISDNGVGVNSERLNRLRVCLAENKPFRNDIQKKNSIGVTNVKQRIDMICKQGSAVLVESTLGQGTSIKIEIVC